MMERAVMMKMADTPTPIEAGEIEIRAQVRLTVRSNRLAGSAI